MATFTLDDPRDIIIAQNAMGFFIALSPVLSGSCASNMSDEELERFAAQIQGIMNKVTAVAESLVDEFRNSSPEDARLYTHYFGHLRENTQSFANVADAMISATLDGDASGE